MDGVYLRRFWGRVERGGMVGFALGVTGVEMAVKVGRGVCRWGW